MHDKYKNPLPTRRSKIKKNILYEKSKHDKYYNKMNIMLKILCLDWVCITNICMISISFEKSKKKLPKITNIKQRKKKE